MARSRIKFRCKFTFLEDTTTDDSSLENQLIPPLRFKKFPKKRSNFNRDYAIRSIRRTDQALLSRRNIATPGNPRSLVPVNSSTSEFSQETSKRGASLEGNRSTEVVIAESREREAGIPIDDLYISNSYLFRNERTKDSSDEPTPSLRRPALRNNGLEAYKVAMEEPLDGVAASRDGTTIYLADDRMRNGRSSMESEREM